MKTEHWRKFLESLEGEKGLPGSYHGVSLSMPIAEFERVNMVHPLNRVERYLLKRIEYLESRQIPDLKERVKELMRDAMEAQHKFTDAYYDDDIATSSKLYADLLETVQAFRALCAKVKP